MYLIAAILFFTGMGQILMISASLGLFETLGGHTSTKLAPSNATLANSCADGCPPHWIGDGYCDYECYTPTCSYDAGDCDSPPPPPPGFEYEYEDDYWGQGPTLGSGAQAVGT